MRSKSAALAAAAVAIAGTGLIATGGTASAATPTAASATPAAAYNGACGSGYRVVNSAGIADLGTVYLTYNSATGKNCVVTIRNTKGDPVYMSASVRALLDEDTTPVVDEGDFTQYAGPVYVKGKGHCIEWSGGIQDEEYFNSGSNCGSLMGGGA